MSTLVCSVNLWSCGLASIEAILADNGIKKSQAEIIADLGHLFPSWAAQPGLMSPGDFEVVFRAVGFPVEVVWPVTFKDTIVELADKNTIGAMIWVTKFWDDPVGKNALADLNHALRLVSADQMGVMVMNPYRCPSPARDEFYTWREVDSFKSGVLVFKK
jgi:hypothetical protein